MFAHTLLIAVVGAASLFPAVVSEESHTAVASVPHVRKLLTKCPRHYSKHKDDLGHPWCMDSAGGSYTPENARYVARLSAKRNRSEKRISTDLANR
jgi:hypothetical protein